MAALVVIIYLLAQTAQPEARRSNSPAIEEHIREVVKELPADSALRESLLHGARGNGVHHPWMDEMRKQGIKRAVVWIDIWFGRKGRPKKMNISHAEYFGEYEGGAAISDVEQLNAIRTTGLEKELGNLAMERAVHGFWPDVPRPRPHPFVGGAKVELFDDEWLPTPSAPLYCACRLDDEPAH